MRDSLERSDIVFEFLAIMRSAPILPLLLRPAQHLLVRAAVDLTLSAGHVKKPNLLCVRSIEHLDCLGRRLQQNLAAIFSEIGLSFRR
jgi:hypothetical protein